MKNKKILIDQPGFIGDIIFVMAIAQKYANEGNVVDFPVFSEHMKEPSIQKYFPEINFISMDDFPEYNKYCGGINGVEDDKYITLPLRASATRRPSQHMKEKYELLGLDFNSWRNIQIKRDYNAEKKLMELLGIESGMEYNLINEFHMYYFEKISIPVNVNEKNINMSKIDGFTLFDWIGVMENAKSIHTVGTSLIFLMDAINSIPNDMHFYPRNDKPYSTYDYLLRKKYIYH
jgi:hypothetical protein